VQAAPGTTDGVPNRFPLGLDRVPFVDCFGVSPGDKSSGGISNHPDYPDRLAALGYPVSGIHGDPGFVDGPKGDFRLRPDSLARGNGCRVQIASDGSISCKSSDASPKPDIGAYQENVLVEGPDYLDRGDERPRVVKATWRSSAGTYLLEIVFSTSMGTLPGGTRVAVRLDSGDIVRSEACQRARETALDCRFANLAVAPDATATLLIPRSLRSRAEQPVTLWAAGPRHVEFER